MSRNDISATSTNEGGLRVELKARNEGNHSIEIGILSR